MTEERLYIIHGSGPDAVGLVGRLTGPIASAGGNIVDLRQDVLHGLFTVFLVVDLGGSALRLPQLESLVAELAEDTGLALTVGKYRPVPRSSDRRNLLLVLIGFDRPGVIAEVSASLGKYRANIEFSQMVARAGVFVMELLVDIAQAELPPANLARSLTGQMRALGIQCLFQEEDVFNKKKRVLILQRLTSLIDSEELHEFLTQTGLTAAELAAHYRLEDPEKALARSASLLSGLPCDLLDGIITSAQVAAGSQELVQTLKVMGYRVVATVAAIAPVAALLGERLGLDACHGYPLAVNEDRRTIEPADGARLPDRDKIVRTLQENLALTDTDIVLLADSDPGAPSAPGLSISLDLKGLLEHANRRTLNRDQLLGLLGAFGIPTAAGPALEN